MTDPAGPAVEQADAVVVGAGIGGLVTAHTLAARGLRVVVLEAADRAGGPIRGGAFDSLPDVPLDLGAESFAVRGGAVERLAGELGLTVEVPAGLPAWGYAAGRAFPLPAAGVLGIPSRPWAPDVRRAVGWPGVLRGSLDRVLPARLVDTTDLGTLTRSRLGSRVADRLVTPVAAGVHSAPLDRLDVAAVAPGLLDAYTRTGSLSRAVASLRAAAPAGSAVRGIDGGIHALVNALVERLDVRFGTRVVGVERVPAVERAPGDAAAGAGTGTADPGLAGPGGASWLVRLEGSEAVLAARLVLATRPDFGPLLTADRDFGRLPRDRSIERPISERPTEVETKDAQPPSSDLIPPPAPERGADIRLVTLLLEAPELDTAPRGSGMLVAPGTAPGTVRAKALTHATAKWPWLARRVRATLGPGWHVVRLSYGRIGEPTPEPTAEEAARDASALLGVELAGRVHDSLHQRWDGSLPPPTPAYRAAIKQFEQAVRAEPGLDVTGGWIAGTGLAAIVGHAWRTAERLGDPAPDGR
ncbi:protoporphyrinogen/coproporphyrinogen oxidase [Promicromonospora iranensis]|uniref:Oxygen-dependent protoporphyrinogen oxidase n=1 Tax=Promicromonospora iranensis TaxID=1105144 RepID=A0ABU2CP51_9MICO|nr:FAD-dependent oxidoreductase [Promicromonospora iranensis]MDR7383098.1 oxygen-dependent protoporphyrinogen oxidase [Promicromonospora iranensis]